MSIKISFFVPSLEIGGMERVVSILGNNLCNIEGVESVSIVTFNSNSQPKFRLSNSVKLVQPKQGFGSKSRLKKLVYVLVFLRKYLRANSDHTFVSFGEKWNLIVLFSAVLLKRNLFVADRSSPAKKYSASRQRIQRFLYPKAKGVFVQTNWAREAILKKELHKNVFTLPNPTEFSSKATGLIEREKIVVSVGRFIKTKHFDLLIDYFTAANEKRDWKLFIIGGDPNNVRNSDKLVQKIKEKNASDFIKLLGFQTDIASFLSKAQLFAFTSSSEGFPNSLLEAISHSLPCVAFDCIAGPSEMVDNDKNGFLVKLFDHEGFVSSLHQLMYNDTLRLNFSEESFEKSKQFRAERVTKIFLSFINEKV